MLDDKEFPDAPFWGISSLKVIISFKRFAHFIQHLRFLHTLALPKKAYTSQKAYLLTNRYVL